MSKLRNILFSSIVAAGMLVSAHSKAQGTFDSVSDMKYDLRGIDIGSLTINVTGQTSLQNNQGSINIRDDLSDIVVDEIYVAGTTINPNQQHYNIGDFDNTISVPEPSTIALGAIGLVALAYSGRRKR